MKLTSTIASPAAAMAAALCGVLLLAGCSGELGGQGPDGAAAPNKDGAADRAVVDAAVKPPPRDGAPPPPADGAPDLPRPDGAVKPPPKPKQLAPCAKGNCYGAPALSNLCGSSSLTEDFSTGKYNVHRYALSPQKGVKVTLTLSTTAGSWKPALVIHDAAGATVHDGALASSSAALTVQPLASGKGSSTASVRVTAHKQASLKVFVTGWSVINSGFSQSLPKAAKYKLTVASGCAPPKPGKLLSPPNFDPTNKKKGYYLLPYSQPSGLYKRKADDCSRGTKLLIDVIYTVATHWKQKMPSLSPISILDMNEGTCSSVNHATHDDGTHVDLTAGCATQVSCTNNQPAIDLAKLFVDTGQVCGIINNDPAVQKVVNAYFTSKFSYKPWHGTFMRSVSGHTHHFHVRVKKPNGSCN